MIDEKKLIEDIKGIHYTCIGMRNGKTVLSNFAKQYREDVLKTIEEQPKVGEWIPVSERLPNIKSVVLVQSGTYRGCKGKPIIHIAEYTIRKEGFFKKEKGFYEPYRSMPFKYDNVVAWMPLPAPYKESED